ncbi:hypothetical protein JSY36_13450 [Bacillus sp. H-16]|uniref:hypothetical protein n=1 Tax=Alteribacter salitolerans TaxID=2912333 RepID=UPI00196439E5|nr:hypothetical protein [Alteribacter salitolerans]MBM7096747.1 hypothetical protein [Alteribacter salitolerans]
MKKTMNEVTGKITPDDGVYNLENVTPNEMAILDLALKDRADIMRQVAEIEKNDTYLQMAEEAEKLREDIKR